MLKAFEKYTQFIRIFVQPQAGSLIHHKSVPQMEEPQNIHLGGPKIQNILQLKLEY